MAPKQYLTRSGIADLLGVKHTTITGYDERGLLPEPDVLVGRTKGWEEATIVEWNKNRPGRGFRTDTARQAALLRHGKLTRDQVVTDADKRRAKKVAAAALADSE